MPNGIRRIEALRVEQGRLGELLREQERLLEHRISACHSVFARFDAVQEDFAKRPSMDESRFYGMMLDDDDDEEEAAVVEGVATEDVEERVTTSMEEAQTGGEVAEDEQS